MNLAILADEEQKEELSSNGLSGIANINWINNVGEFPLHVAADAWFDLQFQADIARITLLKSLAPKPVFISLMDSNLQNLPDNFIRINTWPGFLNRVIVEAATLNDSLKAEAEKIINAFSKTITWTADIPGFLTPRIISMIINEAYFTLGENVSGKTEIDTAMKLGTNYPFGPFEWSEIIGKEKIYNLLTKLVTEDRRYDPAPFLIKEANS